MSRSPDTMSREELEEEVAYLRSELNTVKDERATLAIRRTFDLAPTETAFLLALYNVRGRTVSHWMFDEMVPPTTGRDRDPGVAAVYIWRIRKALGRDAIKSEWGRGYFLTPSGIADVEKALTAEGVAA